MASADVIYAFSPDVVADDGFVPGDLGYLVAGNQGRMLDPRRTPVEVTGVSPGRGSFEVRVCAFEDAGAIWELPLAAVVTFQFPRAARRASDREVAGLRRSLERFDRDLAIEAEPTAREACLRVLARRRADVAKWLAARSGALQVDVAAHVEGREGNPFLYGLVEEFLAERGLEELESSFTTTFVSNPGSGEVVKGHAMVAAKLGLCPYRGTVARDPKLFSGDWSRRRRAEHLLWRLALTQELWRTLGGGGLACYRGTASETPLRGRPDGSFVSATMSKPVAQAHFEGGPTTSFGAIWRQVLPLDRVVMSFLETRAMNRQFHEAEIVLLGDPANPVF